MPPIIFIHYNLPYLKNDFKVIMIDVGQADCILLHHKNENILISYIKQAGIITPILFIIFQILQVIIPIFPGGVSCIAGVILFGPFLGFIYNYISIIIGSCIAFHLSKKYGLTVY